MKRLFTSIFLLALTLTTVSPVFAQEPAAAAPPEATPAEATDVCAPYLAKDSITLSATPTVTETIPGSTVTLVGSVKNSNSFPVVSGEVWARVYRVASGDPVAVVDQFQVANNLTLKAASETPLTFSWEAPNNLPSGTYRVVLSLISQKDYTVKNFVDSWTTEQNGTFSVIGDKTIKTVTFNPSSIKINGVTTDALKREILVSGEEVTVSVTVKNDSSETKRVPLQWNQYAWSNLIPAHIRNTKTEVLTLAPNESKELTYTVTSQAEGVTELAVVTQDGATKHMLPLTFVREGRPAATIAFAALSNPLLKQGEEGTLFACVQNLDTEAASKYSLSFMLTDSTGTVIHESEQPFIADAAGVVKTNFTPPSDLSASKLTVALKFNGATVFETTTTYDCQTVAGIVCEAVPVPDFMTKYGMYIVLAIVMLLLTVVVVLQLIKRRRTMVAPLLFAGILFGLSLFAPGHVTFAQSCTLGSEVQIADIDGTNAGIPDMRTAPDCQATNYIDPAYGGTGMYGNYAPCNGATAGSVSANGACISRIDFSPKSGAAFRCQVYSYECAAGASGSAPTTPVITGPTSGNTNVTYNFDVMSTDPDNDQLRYGLSDSTCTATYEWLPGTGYVPSGTSQTESRSWGSDGTYTLYVFAEDGAGNRSTCAQHTLNVTTPVPAAVTDLKINNSDGPLSVTKSTSLALTWSAADTSLTTCTLYGPDGLAGGVPVPQTGSMTVAAGSSGSFVLYCGSGAGEGDVVAVDVVNQTPNAPTVTYTSGTLQTGQNITFAIQGIDPDNDNVFYEIDWNMDGVTDATTMSVPSNTAQPATQSWPTAGTKTFQARTVDTVGARSGWTQHSETLTVAPPTAGLEVSVNGGAYTTSDTTIDPTDSLTIKWGSTNAGSCTGTNFNTGGSANGTTNPGTPAPNSAVTYSVDCGGATDSITITVRQRPNFSQPNITYTLSTTFNATTGYYDWVDVTFNTNNNGGSDTKASANYQFRFDRGRDGYEYTTTGSLGLLTVGQTVTRTERVTGNIPFGNARIEVTADNTNAVAETDEGDNTRTLDLTIPPPDPGLSLTADKVRLRQGETTTIRWSVANPYAGLSCVTYGPNLASQNATLPSGNRTTAAIEAQSVYTLECTESITNTKFTKTVTIETEGKIEEI